jgi:two-component system, OmpR family, osmolarity sensor histidine kinase EnvZ
MKPADQPEDLSAVEILHDLQTLLARIRLATDLLHSQDQVLLRAIHQDITTCQSLICQQFSPTDGAIERLAPTDLNALIQEEIIVLQRGQQTVLEQDLCEGTLWVEMQRLGIQRVLTNLLMNARHYGQGWVQISSGRSLESAWFQIDDDGPGIEPDRHAQLFQPWIRGVEIPISNNFAGSYGLGLAIVKKIVDSHHGRLHLGHNIRNGLTIQVILPLKQPF